ncbi:MAG TPA: hypothetical protein VJ596_07565, partial [Gemmatimonadaceae bacterium]|nr:hypothetical protein [Gemmatimonadaceae bacterium]
YTLAPTSTLMLIALVPFNFFVAFPYGAAAAVVQEITPNNMRAQASAMYLFGISFVGVGLGPTAIALVTDYVFRSDDALRYSLLVVTVLATAGSLLLLHSALPWYERSVELLKRWESGGAG